MTSSRRSRKIDTRLRIALEDDQQREVLRRYGVVSPYELELMVDTHPDLGVTSSAPVPIDPNAPMIHAGAPADRLPQR